MTTLTQDRLLGPTLCFPFGRARVVTNATGQILDDSDFYPFGGERIVTSSSDNHYKFTRSPRPSQQARSGQAGKERDPESGLDYFLARYYSPGLGRFYSVDPVSPINYQQSRGAREFQMFLRMLENPQTWNQYAYSFNNALRFADPTGDVVRSAEEVNEEVESRNLRIQRSQLTQFGKQLAEDVKAGKLSSKEAIDKFFEKARELSAGNVGNALLLATASALDLRSALNAQGQRENLASRITEGSLGPDTLHHFFINAFNNFESPFLGSLGTIVANLDEPDPEDRNANRLGATFGAELSSGQLQPRVAPEGFPVAKIGQVFVPVRRDPLRPIDVIP